MTTPPVPQWAVDAAKELHEFDWGIIPYDQLMSHIARIIAAHAPHGNEDGARLDWLEEHACEEGRTMAMPRYSYRVKQWSGDPGPNIRSAIDIARKDTREPAI